MSLIRKLFGFAGQDNHLPPSRTYTTPPVPEGEWALIVDANGDEVVDRAPLATDFLARRPVVQLADMGGETYPLYQYDRHKDRDENGAAYVAHLVRSRKNNEHLEKAIFLLSQTDDGRRLLYMAKKEKFKIVFDSSLCAEEGALGLCDYTNKKIPLAEGRSAAEVALTLKHELQHMEDIRNGLTYSHMGQPRNAVFANRALESNARVSESVLAAEILLGSPRGPERQFRTGALFDNLFHKNPPVAKAAHAALADAKTGQWQDFAAKVFPAYFQQQDTLTYYDNRYAKMLTQYAPDVRDSIAALAQNEQLRTMPYEHQAIHRSRVQFLEDNAPALFTRAGLTPDESIGKLSIGGLPYTNHLRKQGFNPAADAHTAIMKDADPAFDVLRDTLQKGLPNAGLHEKLDLPVAAPARITATVSPYRGEKLGGTEKEFTPYVMPHRIDGYKNSTSDDLRSNERMTLSLQDCIDNVRAGNTLLERLHFATTEFVHRHSAFTNIHGRSGVLLSTGFKAPISAFPDDFIFDLYKRTIIGSEHNSAEGKSITADEVRLFAHWQEMRDRGLDHVWGDATMKKDSWMIEHRFEEVWHGALASLTQQKPAETAASTLRAAASGPSAGMPA